MGPRDLWNAVWRGLHGEAVERLLRPGTWGITMTLGSGYDREAEEVRQRAEVVAFMRSQLGKPYRLGAEVGPGFEEGADDWDCSEIVEAAFRRAGAEPAMPDGSPFQFDACRPIAAHAIKPGDLGFLWSDKWGRIGHVWAYTGDGTVVHAVGGRGVVEDPSGQWEALPRFRGARRHPGWAWPEGERA